MYSAIIEEKSDDQDRGLRITEWNTTCVELHDVDEKCRDSQLMSDFVKVYGWLHQCKKYEKHASQCEALKEGLCRSS